MQIDLDKYTDFVEAITSQASNDLTTFINSLDRVDGNYDDKQDLHGPDVNVPLLLTGAMGMCGEAGEFSEIVKKVLFHSKPLTEEVHAHLIKELGDVIWYWTNTCRALGVNHFFRICLCPVGGCVIVNDHLGDTCFFFLQTVKCREDRHDGIVLNQFAVSS